VIDVVELKRKKGETFESFVRRFNKRLQQSGRLFQARKVRFFTRTKSKTRVRAEATKRAEFRAKRDYLKRIGKLPEEEPRRRP
jgi:ribosomal protein S21